MARDVSFMQYMRAHGNTAGPTQRPLLTGAISGLLAFVPYELVLRLSGGRASIAAGFGISVWTSSAMNMTVMVVAGVIYASIFKRAANDCSGGWIFGASYGFLLWMIAPITLWQLLGSRELAVGTAAMGLFGAHVLYGLVLGLVFPWIHFLIQSRLRDRNDKRAGARSDEQGGE
jgi:hypothetical protein